MTEIEKQGPLVPVSLPPSTPCRIIKWVSEPGARVRKGTVLLTYSTDVSSAELSETETVLKSTLVGVVKERLFEEGEIVHPGAPVVVLEEKCYHSIVVHDLCTDCGRNLRSHGGSHAGESDVANVTVVHGITGIRISQKEAEALGHKDKLRMLNSQKLALIVDLDQTLIHTSVDPNIEPGLQDVYGFRLPGHPMLYHCRLRPYAREFLEKISKLYEMHVFTMGTNSYAASIARILDPERKLFCDRIISRDECFDPYSKVLRLKSVFPCGDEMVAIIDDREDVWSRCPNLIHVKPYVFFAGTADINAPPSRPSTTPTSTAVTTKPPDGAPFKVRHMTSSRNNNIKPPVAMATHHLQASNESKQPSSQLHVARKSKLHESTTAEDTPAIIEQVNDQAMANVQEDSNDGVTPEIYAEGDKSSSVTSHPGQTNPDLSTSVHQDNQEMKSDVPADHAPVEISDNSLITQSNSNANNNNENGDDPSNKKDDNSSSSSDSSSSNGEEEEGDGDGVEQEEEVNGRNKRESSSSSSSSSSGIDDNLFDSLDENVDDLDRGESKGATAMEAGGAVDTSKLEGAYMVAGTEKLVRESAEGMEISMVEQDISAGNRDKDVEKADLTADSASVTSNKMEVGSSEPPPPPIPPQSTNNQTNKSTRRRRSIEVKDPDTFLEYLGDILERLHSTFYKQFDEMAKGLDIDEVRDIPIPDLKKLIPEMRRSVLKGTRILFTGVIPTNMPPHKNREWNTARAFGAIIHDRLVPGLHSSDPNKAFRATTHVVAGRPGTSKLREAKRLPGVKVVNPRWLWSCAEQWRLVDEKLFPLKFEKEKCESEAKQQNPEGESKLPPRKIMKIVARNHEEDKPLAPTCTTELISTKAAPTEQQSIPPPTDISQPESSLPTPVEKTADPDSDSDSDDNDETFLTGDILADVVEKDSAMLQNLREFKRHMSLESRLSVSDEELEKMDAEVEAEISSSESSNNGDEDLGTFIEEKDDDNLLSYENYAGSEASSEDKNELTSERLSRKRKHADIENNSSSSNSPSLDHLNDSIEPSDEEDGEGEDGDSDDSVDELGALLG